MKTNKVVKVLPELQGLARTEATTTGSRVDHTDVQIVVRLPDDTYAIARPRLIPVSDIGIIDGERFRDAYDDDADSEVQYVILMEADATI